MSEMATKHVHKWRRLTKAEAARGWSCTHPKCGRVMTAAEWCCGGSVTYERRYGDGECFEGRCAAHGPKPKRRKAEPFERWVLRMIPGNVDAVITCGKEPVIHVYAPTKNFGQENAPRLVRALNAARVVLPKARKR